MPYLNLDTNYFDHPKTRRLVGLLGPMSDVLPLRLWAYCAKIHPLDGALKGYSESEINGILGFGSDLTTLKEGTMTTTQALVKVGFLKTIQNGFACVDWQQHEGHLAAFSRRGKVANKKRWDKYRASIPQGVLKDKQGVLKDKQGVHKSESRNPPTIPNHTVPNPTQPNQLIIAASPPEMVVKKLTPQQIIVRYFKEAKGVNANDVEWDRKHWNGRLGKEANAILKAFDGNVEKAGRYILVKGEEWAHLPDWGLNGVVAAAGRDPRVNGGTEDGREDKSVGSIGVDGPRSSGKYSPSGSLVGDALRAIESSSVLTETDGDMGSDREDFRSDED